MKKPLKKQSSRRALLNNPAGHNINLTCNSNFCWMIFLLMISWGGYRYHTKE